MLIDLLYRFEQQYIHSVLFVLADASHSTNPHLVKGLARCSSRRSAAPMSPATAT